MFSDFFNDSIKGNFVPNCDHEISAAYYCYKEGKCCGRIDPSGLNDIEPASGDEYIDIEEGTYDVE